MNIKDILNMKIKYPLLLISLFLAFGSPLLYVLAGVFITGGFFFSENYTLLVFIFLPLLVVLLFFGFYRFNEYLYGRISEEKRLEKGTTFNFIVGNFFISLSIVFCLICIIGTDSGFDFRNQLILYLFLYLLGIVFLCFSYKKKYKYLIFYPSLFSVSILIPFFNIGYNFLDADNLEGLRFVIIVYFIVYIMIYCLLILPSKKIKGQSLKENLFSIIVTSSIVWWTLFLFFYGMHRAIIG